MCINGDPDLGSTLGRISMGVLATPCESPAFEFHIGATGFVGNGLSTSNSNVNGGGGLEVEGDYPIATRLRVGVALTAERALHDRVSLLTASVRLRHALGIWLELGISHQPHDFDTSLYDDPDHRLPMTGTGAIFGFGVELLPRKYATDRPPLRSSDHRASP